MFHANTMRVKDAKMAAKLQLQLQDSVEGRITLQSAEDASHATFRQSGVDVTVEDLWSLLVRRDLSRPSIAPS